jgi:transposase-like protein
LESVVPKAFSVEFRERAVDLVVVDGGSIAKVAASLGVSASCVDRWVRMARADGVDGKPSGGVTSAERAELLALRKENRRLREEVEITKRAAALFARDNVLPK